MEKNKEIRKLNYSGTGDDDVHPEARAGWVVLGVMAGVAGTIVAGCGGIAAFGQGDNPKLLRQVMIPLMVALSVACWARLVLGSRKGRARWFLMGFLIGAGVMTLIEGACFMSIA